MIKVSGGTGTHEGSGRIQCLNCGEDRRDRFEINDDPAEPGKIIVRCGNCEHRFTIDAAGTYGSI